MQRVRPSLFHNWCQTLDDAVAYLPEDPDWPHELYMLLAERVTSNKARIVMWTEGDVPIGVVALELNPWGWWEPVTQWILPGLIGPVVSGRVSELVATLPFRTRVAWWRMIDSLPQGGYIRAAIEAPTYGMPCTVNFEAYWNQTGQLRSFQKARRRCERLTFSVNSPGASEWVLRNSDAHWRGARQPESSQLSKRILAAKYLEGLGKHVTLTLQDRDKFVAGDTHLIHRQELVATNTFRDRAYDSLGVGNRVADLGFHWAQDNGLLGVDIGGSFDYKRRWAPQAAGGH